MAVSWVVRFIPEDERLVPSPSVVRHALDVLRRFGEETSVSVGAGGVMHAVFPDSAGTPLAAPLAGDEPVPFHLFLEVLPSPTEEVQPNQSRYCRACGRLVAARAECEVCRVEEDPKQWRMGPPVTLYTRAFALGVAFDRAPKLAKQDAAVVERELRRLFGGGIEALEQDIEGGLRLVQQTA